MYAIPASAVSRRPHLINCDHLRVLPCCGGKHKKPLCEPSESGADAVTASEWPDCTNTRSPASLDLGCEVPLRGEPEFCRYDIQHVCVDQSFTTPRLRLRGVCLGPRPEFHLVSLRSREQTATGDPRQPVRVSPCLFSMTQPGSHERVSLHRRPP